MIVLAIDGGSRQVLNVARAFETDGYPVRAVASLEEARGQMMREPPDVVIAALADGRLAEVTNAVREDARQLHYVIGVLGEEDPELRCQAAEAEVDEILLATADSIEIGRTVHAAARIIGMSHRLLARVRELELALRATVEEPDGPSTGELRLGTHRALLTKAWSRVDESLRATCNQYLNMEFHWVAGDELSLEACAGAQIGLTDVEHNMELTIGVYSPEDSRRALATAFCGGDASMVDDEIMRDVMLELANSAMGTVKAEFAAEGFQFTAGIPKSVKHTKAKDASGVQRALCFRCVEIDVRLVVEMHRKERVHVLGNSLREGMVLAGDVLSDTGLLLARAGTRLTETAAQRLGKLVPSKMVELTEAA
ncbi:MAG: hypothetical protein U0263_09165 [Polyangiaceae bacterium]